MRLTGVGLLGLAAIAAVIGLVSMTGDNGDQTAQSGAQTGVTSPTNAVPTGPDGAPLPTGPDGRPLPTGPDGRPVPTGPDGRPLATGADGRPLPTGPDGRPVPTGADGFPLPTGSDGQPLPLGPDGLPPATDATGRPLQPGGQPGAVANPPGAGPIVGEPVGTRPNVRVYNNSTLKGLAQRAATDLTSAGWRVVEIGNYSHGRVHTTTVYYRPGTEEEAAAQAIGAAFGMRVEPRFDGIQQASPGVIIIVTNDYKGPPAAG